MLIFTLYTFALVPFLHSVLTNGAAKFESLAVQNKNTTDPSPGIHTIPRKNTTAALPVTRAVHDRNTNVPLPVIDTVYEKGTTSRSPAVHKLAREHLTRGLADPELTASPYFTPVRHEGSFWPQKNNHSPPLTGHTVGHETSSQRQLTETLSPRVEFAELAACGESSHVWIASALPRPGVRDPVWRNCNEACELSGLECGSMPSWMSDACIVELAEALGFQCSSVSSELSSKSPMIWSSGFQGDSMMETNTGVCYPNLPYHYYNDPYYRKQYCGISAHYTMAKFCACTHPSPLSPPPPPTLIPTPVPIASPSPIPTPDPTLDASEDILNSLETLPPPLPPPPSAAPSRTRPCTHRRWGSGR